MILAIDVHYKTDYAKCVGVLFNWTDETPQRIITEKVFDVAPYEPGQFYKRELPCILKVLEHCNLYELKAIIVDGHVYTTPDTFGLGGHLWEALNQAVPVIGVAKSGFAHNKSMVAELLRGDSLKPLHISAIGIDLNLVVEHVKTMHGEFRMPTILTIMDQHTKTN